MGDGDEWGEKTIMNQLYVQGNSIWLAILERKTFFLLGDIRQFKKKKNKHTTSTGNSINESHKQNVEQEGLDTKEYMHDSNHMKFRTNLW